jgi:tRNA 2-selenouridine synthase
VAVVELAAELRTKRLVDEYAGMSVQGLASSLLKIKESLGGSATKQALEALENGDYETTAVIALVHYDKAYSKSLARRNIAVAFRLKLNSDDPVKAATELLRHFKNSENE